jgi:hypothetical protein
MGDGCAREMGFRSFSRISVSTPNILAKKEADRAAMSTWRGIPPSPFVNLN